MLGRFQELGLKVAFTDVNAVSQPAEPKPSYFADVLKTLYDRVNEAYGSHEEPPL